MTSGIRARNCKLISISRNCWTSFLPANKGERCSWWWYFPNARRGSKCSCLHLGEKKGAFKTELSLIYFYNPHRLLPQCCLINAQRNKRVLQTWKKEEKGCLYLNKLHHRAVRYALFFKIKALFAVVIIYDPYTHTPRLVRNTRVETELRAVVEL